MKRQLTLLHCRGGLAALCMIDPSSLPWPLPGFLSPRRLFCRWVHMSIGLGEPKSVVYFIIQGVTEGHGRHGPQLRTTCLNRNSQWMGCWCFMEVMFWKEITGNSICNLLIRFPQTPHINGIVTIVAVIFWICFDSIPEFCTEIPFISECIILYLHLHIQ